ncbi:nitrite reductase (NADH) small subunit [Paenibacillus sp. NFR01]|nr:nitrite reductase (NADH) small subunit [Paenibacillus sp. NFR01]
MRNMELTEKVFKVGAAESFLPQIGRVVQAGEIELAVFRISDGRFFAVENKNPHPKGGPLAEGIVSGKYLYDPLYDWKIDLETGDVQAPDHGKVRTFPVRLEEGAVIIAV